MKLLDFLLTVLLTFYWVYLDQFSQFNNPCIVGDSFACTDRKSHFQFLALTFIILFHNNAIFTWDVHLFFEIVDKSLLLGNELLSF